MTVVYFRDKGLSNEDKLAKFGLLVEHGAPWFVKAMREMKRIKTGWQGTGEDLRYRLLESGLGRPHHHNAWGRLIAMGIERGLLEPTGSVTPMRQVSSHARKTQVLRRT